MHAVGQLGCAEVLLRILMDYEHSFKVLAAEVLELLLANRTFFQEVVLLHDGTSTLLSLLHADDPALPVPLLRALERLARDVDSAKQIRTLGGINVILSLLSDDFYQELLNRASVKGVKGRITPTRQPAADTVTV